MITEGLLDVIFSLIKAPFALLGSFGFDLSEISILGDILKYGIWIIGEDLFVLVISVVFGYYTMRLSVGVIEWIWKLIK